MVVGPEISGQREGGGLCRQIKKQILTEVEANNSIEGSLISNQFGTAGCIGSIVLQLKSQWAWFE